MSASSSARRGGGGGGGESSRPPRRILRTQTVGSIAGDTIFNSELVPSSLEGIAQILRVANEVESGPEGNRRVAYLCRFYAFEKAHRLDPNSTGRGVRQFKTALLQRLERENDPTLLGRVDKSDASEMQRFYKNYYSKYIQQLSTNRDSAQLTKAFQTAEILFEVLKAVNQTQSLEVDKEVIATHDKVTEQTKLYVPYNILPLDPDSASQAVMQFPEIRAAVHALQNTRGLPWPSGHTKKVNEDILDWLQAMFGFQKDNVSNQREHLILILANLHIRQVPKPDQQPKLDERAINDIMKKLFRNYKKWCKYLGRKPSLWMPKIQQEVQQRKLLYMGLFLLIWGEAANLRFMPECLCYIYHHMAFEVYGMLEGNISSTTGGNIKPAYGGEKEAFLNEVVTPIYNVIKEEAEKNQFNKAKHSHWRNYDDLNEYFWRVDCFRLGWPMRKTADFFCQSLATPPKNNDEEKQTAGNNDQWIGKINFVEIRSFWHLFRSFDRMWSFFIICLQAMIIIAWNGAPSDIFDRGVFKKVLSVFITAAIWKFLQAILDIIFSFKASKSMSFNVKLRYVLKVISAAAWVVILPVCYAYTWENPSGLAGTIKSWVGGNGQNHPSLYILAVIVYLSPNVISALLFLFPLLRRTLERSNFKLVTLLMWWSQPRLFVGRAMHESAISLFMYCMFWVLLIASKLAFSYYFEIKPLVQPTKDIMSTTITTYKWHEFFPQAKNNIGVIIALWAPIILVYFMDAQIWYAIFSTIFGGIYGAFRRLGEIRTLEMLRSRFDSLPGAFNARLVPLDKNKQHKSKGLAATLSRKFAEVPATTKTEQMAKFSQLWNKIITSFRDEDLIDYNEMNLLLVPYPANWDVDVIQWPIFLLANKIPLALGMARECIGKDRELKKKLNADIYMFSAVRECYLSFKNIVKYMVDGPLETQVINDIFGVVDSHIQNGTLAKDFNLSALPDLYDHLVKLVTYLLDNGEEHKDNVVILFQNILEVVTRDIVDERSLGSEVATLLEDNDIFANNSIKFPLPDSDMWKDRIRRLHLLLMVKESAMDVPANLEAQRRIAFFSNSLFMDMPEAPKVRHMISFSVLTPYYQEEVLFSSKELHEQNDDGISILFYLQKIYPDEWLNFLERVGCKPEDEVRDREDLVEELRLWASYRGQTLTRTVRGMMYYRKALELQAFLDMAKDDELLEGYKALELLSEEQSKHERSLWVQCQAVADLKFTYVVSCQNYGIQKRSADPHAQDILRLMTVYPSLRVAYIDEVEETLKDGRKPDNMKDRTKKLVYYSTLAKVAVSNPDDPTDSVQNLDQVIYRIKLPGPAILGEGKPENQNHAIIFTRGEGLQTIDMNQDNYMEEAFKMRNLLQEFLKKDNGVRYPSILGVREHIFTGSVSSLAWFMSNQETSFVTLGQRLLANPLKVRFHYGHPDVFDRLFHLTRGGVSKASKIINLSEDIFAGFNSTLREGNITHHEYLQVGKGRDMGLNQISMFEAKIANGNGEQTLSRDIYRLGHRFDFFRMLSCYFTTIGFYFSTLITVLTVYVFLYGRLYLVLSGLDEGLATGRFSQNGPLQVALASQSFVQLGFLMALPMMMEIGLEKGFRTAVSEVIMMHLQLAPVFFTFSLGTKTHYYGRTLLHGGAEYRATGRGFVVFHAKFAENYRLYSRSHFVKGFELMLLLTVYHIFSYSYRSGIAYIFITVSMWFMVVTWLFAPFLFNPSGFEWQKIVDDWADWKKWMENRGGIGVAAEKSWESWWENEHDHLKHTGKRGIIVEILLAVRFFIYQYGLVYHLNITKHTKSVLVYGVSWLVIFAALLLMKVISMGRKKYSVQKQLIFRFIKGLIFVTFVTILTVLMAIPHMTFQDIIVCIFAFAPTGWGLLLIAQSFHGSLKHTAVWPWIVALARGYDIIMGLFLFSPVAFLAWFPFVSEFQSRMLFNQAFSRGLQISRILGGHKKYKD